MPSTEIGSLLASVRTQAGLTQSQLSERTGIDRGQLASYESGRVDPGATQLLKIARVLNLDVLGEAVPREIPPWVTEFQDRLGNIEAAIRTTVLRMHLSEVPEFPLSGSGILQGEGGNPEADS